MIRGRAGLRSPLFLDCHRCTAGNGVPALPSDLLRLHAAMGSATLRASELRADTGVDRHARGLVKPDPAVEADEPQILLVHEIAPVEIEREFPAEAVVQRQVDAVVVAEHRALARRVVDAVEPALAHVVTQVDAQPRVVEGAFVPLAHAHDVYVARTYAYVANSQEGIAIIDIEQPEHPRLDQTFNAGGLLNDVHQVRVAMTNASLFAYVADGKNGMRIVQLTSPETMPEYAGFSPRPKPVLIATFKTKGEALGISKPLDRERAVDESGNQISVFGRRGARPFTYEEMLRMLRTNDGRGDWFRVVDKPRIKTD